MKDFKKVSMGIVAVLMILVGTIAFSERSEAQADIMALTKEAGYQVDEAYRPKASIVIDALTGQVVWEEEADTKRSIASLSKLMTLYLAFEAMAAGQYELETVLSPSDKIVAISEIYSLSNNKMKRQAQYTIKDIIHLVIVPSSNAATVMLANYTSGDDEAKFIQMMNAKAKELGMTNTTYYNATGASSSSFLGNYQPVGIDPEGDNLSTARDLSILIYHFLKNYPQILEFTNKAKLTVLPGTPYEEHFDTYLFSLPGAKYAYEGLDGLKTGSSPSAAYGYGASAKRDETRFIEVILGVGQWEDDKGEEMRHPIGNALLDKLFSEYAYKKLLTKGKQVINEQEIILAEDYYSLVPINQEVTFKLANNQLQVDNSLATVSELIAPTTVAYQAVNAKGAVKENKRKESVSKQGLKGLLKQYQAALLLLSLGLVVTLLSLFFKKPKQGMRHAKKRSNGGISLIFGALLLVSGLIVGVLTYLAIIKF